MTSISSFINWLRQSAKGGHLSAIREWAAELWQGKRTKQDKIEAYKWMLAGVMKGDVDSRLLLETANLTLSANEIAQAKQRFESTFIPENKRTLQGLYLSARAAYRMWEANPGAMHIIDVRSQAEYSLTGHAPMAFNIPVETLASYPSPSSPKLGMRQNPEFISTVKNKFKVTDTLVLICRSGHRSAHAAKLLAKAGYATVYSVVDGFEGDNITPRGGPNNGRPPANGWKQAKAPWTYKLRAKLVYSP